MPLVRLRVPAPSRPGTVAVALSAALLGVGTPGLGALPSAFASPAQRAALCDGFAGECSISVDKASAYAGQTLTARARGNNGAVVDLQLFAVEFNRAGELTGLVPVGEPVSQTVFNSAHSARFSVVLPPESRSGWGFVGLAGDTGLDMDDRLGVFVGLGGTTLTLLGDGYAEQKPVGEELDMHVLGHVPTAGYWVEYQADDGTWIPTDAAAQAQDPGAAPNEVGSLTYTVPDTLVPGRTYTFRTNTHLNYAGGRLVSRPSFATWTVVPSGTPPVQARSKNFDPTLGPGTPDPLPSSAPTASPAPVPTAQPTAQPSVQPSPRPSNAATPTATPTARPTAQPTATAAPEAAPTASPDENPAAPLTRPAAPTSAPSATAAPTRAPGSGQSPSPQGQSRGQASTGPVWGEEETVAQAVAAPVDDRISLMTALGVSLLLLAPGLAWGVARFRAGRVAEETL